MGKAATHLTSRANVGAEVKNHMAEKVQLREIAGATAEFYGELLRKGIKPEDALAIAKQVGKAASSNSDGHCGSLARGLP